MRRLTSVLLAHPNVALFLLVVVATLAFRHLPFADTLDRKVADVQFRFLYAYFPKRTEDRIVVVGIDEESTQRFREPLALWHPHLARFLDAMAVAGPATVGVDLVLPDKSYEFIAPGFDRLLLQSLMRFKPVAPVILGQTVDEGERLRPIFAPVVAIAGRDAFGLVLIQVDGDGMVRRFRSDIRLGALALPTLAARMAANLGVEVGDGLFDYALGRPFGYIPLQRVTGWLEEGDSSSLKRVFAGKAVLLGGVLPFVDRHRVPVPLAGWEPESRTVPGILIHAQALRSLLAGALVGSAPSGLVWLSVLLAATLGFLSRPLPRMAILSLFLLSVVALSTAALVHGIFVPIAAILFAALVSVAGRMAFEAARVYRERRSLKASFGGYVSPPVLQAILSGRLKPDIGGERRAVCVLFADIRNFTKRSESQSPEAIIGLLNRYFDRMTAAIHRHGGTLDKFIGDGMMAFFGAPNPRLQPALDGYLAGREMLFGLARLNRELEAEGIEPIRIGIGLHLGDVVVGHVGSRTRNEYTAIGDTVNVASRLEGLTKEVGYPLLCSRTVARALSPTVALIALGPRSIKGHTAIEVFGWKESYRPSEKEFGAPAPQPIDLTRP